MRGSVMFQLFDTNVRSRPRFLSLSSWSQSKQTALRCFSLSESYRALTAVSAALLVVGAAWARGVAHSGTPAVAAAAVRPAVLRKPRRLRLISPLSQSGHTTCFV